MYTQKYFYAVKYAVKGLIESEWLVAQMPGPVKTFTDILNLKEAAVTYLGENGTLQTLNDAYFDNIFKGPLPKTTVKIPNFADAVVINDWKLIRVEGWKKDSDEKPAYLKDTFVPDYHTPPMYQNG